MKARKPLQARGLAHPVQRGYAMTSRTNRNSEGENQKGRTRLSPAALQQRRQEALQRSLAGDPIAVICREMSCAKSWLHKYLMSQKFQKADARIL